MCVKNEKGLNSRNLDSCSTPVARDSLLSGARCWRPRARPRRKRRRSLRAASGSGGTFGTPPQVPSRGWTGRQSRGSGCAATQSLRWHTCTNQQKIYIFLFPAISTQRNFEYPSRVDIKTQHVETTTVKRCMWPSATCTPSCCLAQQVAAYTCCVPTCAGTTGLLLCVPQMNGVARSL